MALTGIGLLLFLSTFVTFMANFGNFDNFKSISTKHGVHPLVSSFAVYFASCNFFK